MKGARRYLWLRELLAALLAGKASLRVVDEGVPLHVGLEGEGASAHGARERLHRGVGRLVRLQVVLLHELHAAHLHSQQFSLIIQIIKELCNETGVFKSET